MDVPYSLPLLLIVIYCIVTLTLLNFKYIKFIKIYKLLYVLCRAYEVCSMIIFSFIFSNCKMLYLAIFLIIYYMWKIMNILVVVYLLQQKPLNKYCKSHILCLFQIEYTKSIKIQVCTKQCTYLNYYVQYEWNMQ